MNPKRVRNGIKLSSKEGVHPSTWAGQRWARLVEEAVAGDEAVEAVEYAVNGQTRRMTIENGVVRAAVQGRADRPYQITLEFQRFAPEQWDKVVGVLADQAVHAAKLLAGELPTNIEDLLAPLGLKLFPTEATDVKVATTCKTKPAPRPDGSEPWSKHMGCVGYLLADKLDADPFLIFQLRGMDPGDLLERVRQQRALAGLGGDAAPVYAPVVPGASDVQAGELDNQDFWAAGPELGMVETPVRPPDVSHPLLRRLGSSPFQGRFPLVGLLATCYDLIGTAAIQGEPEEDPDLQGGGEAEPDDTSEES
ncbi:MAG: hypothetical protein AAGB51_07080 [Planctomycetota bacterium]